MHYEQYSPLLAKDTTLQQERSITTRLRLGELRPQRRRRHQPAAHRQQSRRPLTHIYDGGTYPIAAVPLQSPNGGDYADSSA